LGTSAAISSIRAEIAEKYRGDEPIPLDEPLFGPFDFQAVRKWKDREGNEHQYEDGGVFARACRMAGIDQHGLTPHHVTRHTAATLALANGTSILGAMAQGGWDSMLSMQRYTKPTLAHAREAARARSRTVVAR
jgi:integrase